MAALVSTVPAEEAPAVEQLCHGTAPPNPLLIFWSGLIPAAARSRLREVANYGACHLKPGPTSHSDGAGLKRSAAGHSGPKTQRVSAVRHKQLSLSIHPDDRLHQTSAADKNKMSRRLPLRTRG